MNRTFVWRRGLWALFLLAALVLGIGPAAASGGPPRGTAAPATASVHVTYHLRAWVDGRSNLILTGNTAHWHHYDWAAPGREAGVNLPTYVDGFAWMPEWPSPGENRWCNCDSSTFTELAPPVPVTIQSAALTQVGDGCRYSCTLTYAGGQFAVEFNDDPPGGSDWYEVQVDVTGIPSDLTLGPLPAGVVGAAYDHTITATGGTAPYTFSLASGSLPPGLSLSSSGHVTGTPTATGTSTFTAKAEDSSATTKSGERTYAIVVTEEPTSWDLAADFRTKPNHANPNPDQYGNPEVWWFMEGKTEHDPYAYTLLENFVPNAFGISGLEEWQGTVESGGPLRKLPEVGINATGADQAPDGMAWPAGGIRVHPLPRDPAIVGWRSPVSADIHIAASFADMHASCGDGIGWSIDDGGTTLDSGRLPNGGQPQSSSLNTHVDVGTTLYFVVDDGGAGSEVCDSTGLAVSIEVGGQLTLGPLPSGTAGQAYDHTITASGGTAPYTFSLVSGSLPPGLSLSSTGTVSGTPSKAGTSTFSVRVKDASTPAKSGVRAYALTIVPGPFAAISIAASTPVTAGVPFTVTAHALDSVGDLLTTYNAAATWSSLDGALSPAAPNDFVDGKSTTTATIADPFQGDRITVTSGGISGVSAQFDVAVPPLPNSISVRVTTPVGAGAPFTVTATARDASGGVMRTYSGSASWSDRSGALSPTAPASFVNGISTTQAVVPSPFHADRITVTTRGVSGTSGSFNVYGPFARIAFAGIHSIAAGSSFAVRAYATDTAGNVVRSYAGAAAWSDLSGNLAPSTPADFVDGVSTTTATVADPYHLDRITLTSGGVSGQSIYFNAFGGLAKITMRIPGPVSAGVPFTFKAYARDALGSVITTYGAAATWSDLSGNLAPAAPDDFVNGVSTTQATISAPYHQDRITVSTGGVSQQGAPLNVL